MAYTEQESYQNDDEDFTIRMPVKNHQQRLDLLIDQLNCDLEQARKDKEALRNSVVELSQICTDAYDEANNLLQTEYARLMQEFQEQNSLQSEQHIFLRQQVDAINLDRIKLQQNAIVLDNRVQEVEKELGFI